LKEHCRETLEKAFLFLDGEILSAAERREIQVRLEECAPCLERYGMEQEVTTLLARLRGGTQCPDKLRLKIRSLIEEA
jgi:mycothiol system anti-sigma-R factor